MAQVTDEDWYGEALAEARALGINAPGDKPSPTATEQQMDPHDVARSLISNKYQTKKAGLTPSTFWKQTAPLIRWQGPVEKARSWRVTLAPLQRFDGASQNVYDPDTQQPLGRQIQNVAGGVDYLPPAGNPQWVRVRWGVGGASPFELIAHWPVRGSSFDVVGSFVEVEGFFSFDSNFATGGPNPFAENDMPLFQASMAPAPSYGGVLSMDLGFSQYVSMQAGEATYSQVQVPPFARWVKAFVFFPASIIGPYPAQFMNWLGADGQPVARGLAPPTDISGGAGTFIDIAQWEPVPPQAQILQIGSDETDPHTPFVSICWRISP